jgi:hypothetical protein
MAIKDQLAKFSKENKFQGKGPLCVALVVTDHARNRGLPLNSDDLVTEKEGQVLGLGRGKVQGILAKHGITRVLAKEGGRTSRGSMGNMRSYVSFLNQLSVAGDVDLDALEKFWVEQVAAFFSAKPFSLRLDSSLGLRAVVRNLMDQAKARQDEMPGTMFLGTVMQHLVGAKLDLVLGQGLLDHNSANANDERVGRTGDFDIGDVSIHVSTSPSEALIAKCVENIAANRRPVIVTTFRKAAAAEALAENVNISNRLDIFDFEQFIATNIYELGRFSSDQRSIKILELVERYNAIIDEHETDPSLRIEIAAGR